MPKQKRWMGNPDYELNIGKIDKLPTVATKENERDKIMKLYNSLSIEFITLSNTSDYDKRRLQGYLDALGGLKAIAYDLYKIELPHITHLDNKTN